MGAILVDDFAHKKFPDQSLLPPECKQKFNCSVDWLSKVLAYPIANFSMTEQKGGITSQIYRLILNGSDPMQPKSLIVKYFTARYYPAESMNMQFLRLLFGTESLCRKEVNFYQNMRSIIDSIGVKTPFPYFIGFDDYGSRSVVLSFLNFRTKSRMVLLLEDLEDYHHYPMGQLIGEDIALPAVKTMAKMHSHFWNNDFLDAKFSEPDLYSMQFGFKQPFFLNVPLRPHTINNVFDVWQHFFQPLQDPNVRHNFHSIARNYNQVLRDNGHNSKSTVDKELFQNRTLLHGDYNIGNLFFSKKDPSKVALIDWQMYGFGHPSTEFAYFLDQVKFDPLLDKKLMETYHQELTSRIAVPETYPFHIFQHECDIRLFGATTLFFRGISYDNPKRMRHRCQNNPQISEIVTIQKLITENRLLRFTHVVGEWHHQNMLLN